MKKTTNINIAGTLFTIDEEAFGKLEKYFSSIKEYFSSNPDKDEIMKDIESRVAERFLETKSQIITLLEVEAVMESMGTVEQFAYSEEKSTGNEEVKTGQKLYRDPDDRIIAGVCSGLAAFFNIKPIVIRIIFVFLSLMSGGGIAIYILFWMLIPKAKTASQKLSMRGKAPTLMAISVTVEERIDEVKSSSVLKKMAQFIEAKFVPAIRFTIGALCAALGFLGMAGITIALGMALFNSPAELFHPIFAPLFATPLFFVAVSAAYFSLFIPALCIGLTGSNLLSQTQSLSKTLVLSLLGAWFISLVVAGVTIPSFVFRAQNLYDQNTSTDARMDERTDARIDERMDNRMLDEHHLFLEGDL